MKRTLIAATAAALLLASCASVVSAPAGPYALGKDYSVTLGREWSDVSGIMYMRPKKVRLLSIDGPLLNRLYLTEGLAPGEFLVKPTAKEKPTPIYRAGMSASERIEFVSQSVTALDYQRVETARPRPAKFGDADAIRVDLTARTAEGLDMAGTALLAEVGGKLHVILYLAPAEHYYRATLPEVETVMESVKRSA